VAQPISSRDSRAYGAAFRNYRGLIPIFQDVIMQNERSFMSHKKLGIFAIVMMNIIAVDSLRSLPFSAVYGFSLVFYYLLASLVFFIPIALVSAELATGCSNRGGIYLWVREAFGEHWGFLTIWLQWIYNVVWYPTILAFIAGALAYLINPALANNKFYMLSAILLLFWFATFINCFGMRWSSLVSTLGALIGTLIPMLLIIALGSLWFFQGKPLQITFSYHTFFPHLSDVNNLSFLIAVLFGLIGVEMSAVHADEVRNPGKTYPIAIFYSCLLIIFGLVFASLAIAIVVPEKQLNLITDLIAAFMIFFNAYHMTWMKPIITLLIIIGGISGVSAWVLGPTKGLVVATQEGNAPLWFGKINRRGVPINLLLLQAVILTLLCTVFLLLPSVSSSYWVLTAITAQLALFVYILMFAAAIRLRYKKRPMQPVYKIPGNRWVMWLVAGVGILSCITAIGLGFIPPAQIKIGSVLRYETILVVGIVVLCAPPFIIQAINKSLPERLETE
jgi:putative glutamate/gamma-aminobutyrate antiporter